MNKTSSTYEVNDKCTQNLVAQTSKQRQQGREKRESDVKTDRRQTVGEFVQWNEGTQDVI
jgi:hypothetical protein